MKRPVELVQQVIEASSFPFDDIFQDSIPKEEINAIDKTQILITEASFNPDNYGNSEFISINYGVYIQIFYTSDPNSSIDTIKSEIDLMQTLGKAEWLVTQSQARYEDPNTGQMIKNLTVQRTFTLSEIANS